MNSKLANELLAAYDNPYAPATFIEIIPMLKCNRCRSKNLWHEDVQCPKCGSYDLVDGGTRTVYHEKCPVNIGR